MHVIKSGRNKESWTSKPIGIRIPTENKKALLRCKGYHVIDGCNWARRENKGEMLQRIDKEVLWDSLSILKGIRQEKGRNY